MYKGQGRVLRTLNPAALPLLQWQEEVQCTSTYMVHTMMCVLGLDLGKMVCILTLCAHHRSYPVHQAQEGVLCTLVPTVLPQPSL